MYESEHKLKYDKNLEQCEFVPLKFLQDSKCIGFEYTKHKKNYPVSSRDYFEKVFQFQYNDKFYKYSCSIPDSEKGSDPLKPTQKDTVRGFNFINCSIIYAEDQNVIYTHFLQCDPKISMSSMFSSSKAAHVKQISEAVRKYYAKVEIDKEGN